MPLSELFAWASAPMAVGALAAIGVTVLCYQRFEGLKLDERPAEPEGGSASAAPWNLGRRSGRRWSFAAACAARALGGCSGPRTAPAAALQPARRLRASSRTLQPRPTYGIFVAMIVMVSTFASSGRLAI